MGPKAFHVVVTLLVGVASAARSETITEFIDSTLRLENNSYVLTVARQKEVGDEIYSVARG